MLRKYMYPKIHPKHPSRNPSLECNFIIQHKTLHESLQLFGNVNACINTKTCTTDPGKCLIFFFHHVTFHTCKEKCFFGSPLWQLYGIFFPSKQFCESEIDF